MADKFTGKNCIECGEDLSTKSVYKHAVNCFHLPDRGIESTLNDLAGKNDERSNRIREMLSSKKAEADNN